MQLRVALPAANPPDHPVTKPFSSPVNTRASLPCAFWKTMTFIDNFRRDWLSNIRGDVLAGIVVALALIPEAIGFSIIAGVDPKVALYASFSIAVIISITGGRPGMISAATAATAVLMITLVRDHGLEYLLAADDPRRGHSGAGRPVPPRLRDALRLTLRHDGLRQCARHHDLHGAVA